MSNLVSIQIRILQNKDKKGQGKKEEGNSKETTGSKFEEGITKKE